MVAPVVRRRTAGQNPAYRPARPYTPSDHGDLLTDESAANLIRAEMFASIESSDRCTMQAMPTPAVNQWWIVEHVHDLDCPEVQP